LLVISPVVTVYLVLETAHQKSILKAAAREIFSCIQKFIELDFHPQICMIMVFLLM